jgi:hypothetical protein
MTRSKDNLAFMSSSDRGIGNPALAIDHVLTEVENRDCSVTETWWWCFHIEERHINGEVYFWKHSNLNTMSGGVWIFEGIKKHHLLCEHFNYLNFIPAPQVSENTLYSPHLNLRINILEPLKKHEVLYHHEPTGTSLRLLADAMQPPVLRSNNAHFEQVQKITGELRLTGELLKIDCMSFRDRSWGEPRPEPQAVHPPTAWSVGVSADGSRSFCFSACDDPERTPLVAQYGISKADVLKIGWISENGVVRKIVAASKATTRGSDGLQAASFDIQLTDETGRTYHLKGRVTASVMWSPWPNMAATFGQHVVWSLDDIRMTGETQEVFWGDCIKKMLAQAG